MPKQEDGFTINVNNMNHKKTLLESDWYHVSIRSASIHNGGLRLVFTIDRGEYAYRNVVEMFSLTERGMERLTSLFLGINYTVVTDHTSDLFIDQFTNDKIRAKARIDRQIKGDVIKNRVIELQPPEKPEDYNVLKPKSDKFYNQNNSGKDLPINGG